MEKAVLFKIREGQLEVWRDWCREIGTTLRAEAISTLEEEKVLQETTLGFSVGDDYYVIGYMDGECLPANMDREINQRHKALKQQCLERVAEVEVLYSIKQ